MGQMTSKALEVNYIKLHNIVLSLPNQYWSS